MLFSLRRKLLVFGLCLIFVLLAVFHFNPSPSSLNADLQGQQSVDTLHNIFEVYKWKEALLGGGGSSPLCDIPSKSRQLSDHLCRIYQGRPCDPRLPCRLLHSSPSNSKSIECEEDGRIRRGDTSVNSSGIECQLGFSLDLFDRSHPSLIVDPYIQFSKEFYLNYLSRFHRDSRTIWMLNFNFESLSNYPWNKDPEVLRAFNLTFGYDRKIYDFTSKPWLFDFLDQLTRNQFHLTPEQILAKRQANHSHVHSSTLWINGNCQTQSRRTEYLNELMKHLPIDNYGTCGDHQLPLPEHIVQLQKSQKKVLKERHTYNWLAGKLSLTEDYLFSIAFENSDDSDYITEKLWHPLMLGTIPIYYGAPNVQDWLPCEGECLIDLRKFSSPKEAAQFISTVARNESLYRSFHTWRLKPWRKTFVQMLDYFRRLDQFSYNCILCSLAHRAKHSSSIQPAIEEMKRQIGRF